MRVVIRADPADRFEIIFDPRMDDVAQLNMIKDGLEKAIEQASKPMLERDDGWRYAAKSDNPKPRLLCPKCSGKVRTIKWRPDVYECFDCRYKFQEGVE